ncbi:MAG: hypothetical protein ABH828_00880 [archaeon]
MQDNIGKAIRELIDNYEKQEVYSISNIAVDGAAGINLQFVNPSNMISIARDTWTISLTGDSKDIAAKYGVETTILNYISNMEKQAIIKEYDILSHDNNSQHNEGSFVLFTPKQD